MRQHVGVGGVGVGGGRRRVANCIARTASAPACAPQSAVRQLPTFWIGTAVVGTPYYKPPTVGACYLPQPAAEPAPKPAPKGKHVQLFSMKRKVGKGF